MKVLDCMLGIFAGIGIIGICLRIYDVINKCRDAVEKTEAIDRHENVLRDIARELGDLAMDHARTRSHVHALISNEAEKDES